MKRRIIYSLGFVLIITGCAQIGSLTGGERDTIPPKLIKSKPEEKALNFIEDKLTFSFDEFFVLNNLNSVFLSSPPLSEKPEFKIKRKNLQLILNEELKDTTTYVLWFGDAIADYHENNPMKNFRFVFSTGNILDTLEISGSLKDAFTLEPEHDKYVMLYRTYNDSTPINEIPYYICKTDTAGKFKIDYIKPGNYRIFALQDLDANLKFSLPNEKIAFIDTFIIPKVITETKTDSFKIGSVIHVGAMENSGDTLKNDTVIISNIYTYSPNNIDLFMFTEDKNQQYVINSERKLKGKLDIQFKKLPDSVIVTGLNFQFNDENHFKEQSDTGNILTYWLKDKELIGKDTLKLMVSYFNRDSLENLAEEKDTLKFPFNIFADTLKTNIRFHEFKAEHDSFLNYQIISQTPIYEFDTLSVKLFEVLDTMVVDTKKQELLKSVRPAPDEMIFILKRPFEKNCFIQPLNFDTISNWCTNSYINNNTEYRCKIKDNNISNLDTLKFIFHYDNTFFKGQIQTFKDTLSLALYKQSLISVVRPSADTIQLNFKKNVSEETEYTVSGKDGTNWYSLIKSKEETQILLKLKDDDLIRKDTLILTVKTNDFDNTKGGKIIYEFSKNAVYYFIKQKISKSNRPEREKFFLAFSKPLDTEVSIKALNFKLDNDWYNRKTSKSKDTIHFEIIDRFVANLDTIRISVNYKFLNRFDELEEQNDTVNLIYKRQKRTSKRTTAGKGGVVGTEQKLQKVSIDIPIPIMIQKDSLSERKYFVKYKWTAGKQYLLKLDSLAFKDIYGDYSNKEEIKFIVRKADAYSNLNIKLAHVNLINKQKLFNQSDSLNSADSTINATLDEGQIILLLFNDKKELIKTDYITVDRTLTFKNLIPGNYSAKIYHDKNNNGKWDSGKYLKNIQPEKVLILPGGITITGGTEKTVDWVL